MKASPLSALVVLLATGSCAPPGYMYDTGSFTPRPIDTGYYPANPPRIAEAQPISNCDAATRDKLVSELRDVRRQENDLRDRASHDDQALSAMQSLGRKDRDLQDQIIAACPGQGLPHIE